jgi:serine phosphatase RsbU (regulator of sigma subunit)/anti-sigma regulatory factor (Ser/Thr protein kinase)
VIDSRARAEPAAEDPAEAAQAQPPAAQLRKVRPASVERRLEQIRSVTDSGLAYLSLEEMLGEVLERIRGALGADTAAVLLLDEDRGVLIARAARGLEEEVRQRVQIPLARGFAGRVAAEARPIAIADLRHADVVNPILLQRGIRSMLGVPLHVSGRVIGVMHVGTLHRRDFVDEDVAVLQLAADRVALAIDNALLSEQRAVTEIMQRTLLPEALPQVPGLRFSAKYLPAGSDVKLGGDWYDVYSLANGRVICVIGDVVGRGVVAASVMAEIRTALRAYLTEGHGMAETMSLLNNLLVSMGRNRSATVGMVEIDLERGKLEALSAGHLPALTVRADGTIEFLEPPHGMLLGVKSDLQFSCERYPFPVGSTLLLYTDGLVERRGEPLDVGLERLADAARLASKAEDASFADHVYRALADHAGSEDDLALVAIESLPIGPLLELTLDARPSVLAGVRRTLGRWLATEGVAPDELFDIALATSEAASNAVEHAYGGWDGHFSVSASLEDREVRVTVTDTGRWRVTKPRGRGRGLAVMRSLVDSVEVEPGERGTTVTLVKRLAGAAE